MEINKTQKIIILDMINREKEICSDKEEFINIKDWENYNDNLDSIVKILKLN